MGVFKKERAYKYQRSFGDGFHLGRRGYCLYSDEEYEPFASMGDYSGLYVGRKHLLSNFSEKDNFS